MNFVLYSMLPIILIIFSFFQPDTQRYIADDGSFSIISPGIFTEKYQELDTDMGKVEVFTLLHQPDLTDDPNYLYLINYYDYPYDIEKENTDSTKDDFIDNLFDESVNESMTSLGGELLYTSDVRLVGGHTGRVTRISYNDGDAIVKSKMYLVDNRFYFLQVYTTKDNSLNTEMDSFLDSFKVLK